MASPAAGLKASEIWPATLAALRPDFWTFFAVAAPFTLLPEMVVSLFGPPPPATLAELTPRLVLISAVIPGIIGAVAQLAAAHMVARPGAPPRVALAAAIAAMPAYVAALIISAIPTGLGFFALVVPGLYLAARLFLVLPVAVLERRDALATLRRSWELTADRGWTILMFLALALLFLLGASVLVGGVSAALGSVLAVVGLKPVGTFIAALLPALLSTCLSIALATAATVVYRRVAG